MNAHGINVILLAVFVACCYGWELPDKSSYEDHPCLRNCLVTEPMICEYNFTMEHYRTLSRACYNCPRNISDCFRPHCVPADGGLRAIKVINRMMPGPAINVCEGDTVVVNVYNEQRDFEGTSIHWHGILQRGSPHMDGVPMVTQCPIPAHSVFQYRFLVDNSGTHFWHAHAGLQRSDGIFGALVVRETVRTPTMAHYDHDLPEHTVIVHDWVDQITSSKFSLHHHGMSDNRPSSILINGRASVFGHDANHANNDMMNMGGEIDGKIGGEMGGEMGMDEGSMGESSEMDHNKRQVDMVMDNMTKPTTSHTTTAEDKLFTPRTVFWVKRGQRYRFRFISNGILNCPLKVSVDQHSISLIASDGFDIDVAHVDSFTIYAGERYDIVLHADQPLGNYWIYVVGLGDCEHKKTFETAILRYHGAMETDPTSQPSYNTGFAPVREANPFHFTPEAVTVAELTSSSKSDISDVWSQNVKKFYVQMDFNKVENYRFFDSKLYSLSTMRGMHAGSSHGNHMFTLQLNKITFSMPMSPVLTQYQELSEGMFCNETSTKKDCHTELCECIHRIKVATDNVVELVLISEAVHGLGYHPMHLHGHAFYVIGMEKLNKSITRQEVEHLDNQGKLKRNLINPVRKDTVMVPDGGYTVIRFKANNPGFWLFHCHVDFHFSLGMTMMIQVGEIHEMSRSPADFPRCGSWKYSEQSSQYSTNQRCSNSGQSMFQQGVIVLMLVVTSCWFHVQWLPWEL